MCIRSVRRFYPNNQECDRRTLSCQRIFHRGNGTLSACRTFDPAESYGKRPLARRCYRDNLLFHRTADASQDIFLADNDECCI